MQRKFLAILALAVAAIVVTALAATAWEREPASAFHERRVRLMRETGGDGVIVLYGYDEANVAASVTPFRQNEEFYYLTGWIEPGAIMLLAPKAHAPGSAPELGQEILYIPAHDHGEENGRAPSWRRRMRTLLPARDSPQFATSHNSTPTSRPHSRAYPQSTPNSLRKPESGEECFQAGSVNKIREQGPKASLADIRLAIGRMRAVKSPGEIALIRKAADASVEAHSCRDESGEAGRVGVRDFRSDEV